MTKQEFITKWSNWWILSKDNKELNEAFAKELNKIIEYEVVSRQSSSNQACYFYVGGMDTSGKCINCGKIHGIVSNENQNNTK